MRPLNKQTCPRLAQALAVVIFVLVAAVSTSSPAAVDVGIRGGFSVFHVDFTSVDNGYGLPYRMWQRTVPVTVSVDADLPSRAAAIGFDVSLDYARVRTGIPLGEPDDWPVSYWSRHGWLWVGFRHGYHGLPWLRVRSRLAVGLALRWDEAGPGNWLASFGEPPIAVRAEVETLLGDIGRVAWFSRARWILPWSLGTGTWLVAGVGLLGGHLPLITVGMRASIAHGYLTEEKPFVLPGLEIGLQGSRDWPVRPELVVAALGEGTLLSYEAIGSVVITIGRRDRWSMRFPESAGTAEGAGP